MLELARGDLSWTAVCAVAEAHAVQPLVTAKVLGVAAPAPVHILETLQRTLIEQTARNAAAITQLRTALERLRAHDVAAVAFKGPALAAMAYGHIGVRRFSDLDILVDPQMIDAARRCLLESGYTRATSNIDSIVPAAGCEETFVPQRRGELPIEIQSRAWKWPLALRLDTSDLVRRRQSIDVAGQAIATLGQEDLVFVLAIHGLYHGWTHLQLICDIDAAARLRPDWRVVIERARDARGARILAVALVLAHHVLGTESGAPLDWAYQDSTAVTLARQIAARLFQPPPRLLAHPWKDWIRLRSREHAIDKMRYAVRTVASERIIWPLDSIRHAYARRKPRRAPAPGAARL